LAEITPQTILQNMQHGRQHRGPQAAIHPEIWPELQTMDRAGRTLAEITAWLAQERGIVTSASSVCRTLQRVRAEAPAEHVPELESASDEDVLRTVIKFARQEMRGAEWKQRQGGATLILKALTLKRQGQPTTSPADQLEPDTSTDWAPTFSVKKM
jgi:hypothetical protein